MMVAKMVMVIQNKRCGLLHKQWCGVYSLRMSEVRSSQLLVMGWKGAACCSTICRVFKGLSSG